MATNQASATSTFEVAEEPTTTQKTTILGLVKDSSGRALEGVLVESSGASRSATTAADGTFILEMSTGATHWLTFEKSGYLQIQRVAEVREGHHFNMGALSMVEQDLQLTTVGPEGGTARDSSGDVELVIPAGALAASVEIRLTHIPSAKELPGPLNASAVQSAIDYALCVAIEPGTSLSAAMPRSATRTRGASRPGI